MRKSNFSAIVALDAAARVVPRVAAPWMGVLWLSALPLRLLQVYFVAQLVRLPSPWKYSYYFLNVSAWITGAFIVSLYGRAVFVRACRLSQSRTSDAMLAPLRVPLSDFLPYLYVSLLLEILFYASLVLVVGWPVALMLSGLAAAVSQGSQGLGEPKLLKAPLAVLKIAARWKPLFATSLVFCISLVFVYVNLYMLIRLVLFIGGPLLGEQLPRWEYIFEPLWQNFPLLPGHGIVAALLAAGTLLVVEPFWLAANVELAQNARERRSGEDLSLWLSQLKSTRLGGTRA